MTKPLGRPEYLEVFYNQERWDLLRTLRAKASHIMEALNRARLEPIVHGSIARGDVKPNSDIDVFLPFQASSFNVETALEYARIRTERRLLVQATPTYAVKAYVQIKEGTTVSFALATMRRVEREFYKFGGEATIENLKNDERVLGVDKRLMLITPTEKGHRESSIIGQEQYAAKTLKISIQTVTDRVQTLLRRDKIGRTGVFVEKEVSQDETFEMALKRLADQNPAVRRRLATTPRK